MPIDHFFTSLASAREEGAIGVVLSGTASDGTIGLRAIKEAGGLSFVQDNTAKYQGMPQAAISAGVADYVLSPHKIAEEIVSLSQHPLVRVHEFASREETLHEGGDYQKIIGELLRTTGVDFSHYKATTLTRRITRRMLVNKTATPQEYLKLLRVRDEEATALFNDILINVTGFFRDPPTMQALINKVLPRLVRNKQPKVPLRVWVAGCSTGEEVYSLAIALLEFLGDGSPPVSLQIFATDLSPSAIEKARRGAYTRSDVNRIEPRRLEKFFLKVNGSYQIRKHVRDMCVFSVHNLLKDPPFSRIDVVSCCNVLIYMDSIIQRKVFSAFHYALVPGGALVLGKSETTGSAPGQFTQIDKKGKVFIRKENLQKNTRSTRDPNASSTKTGSRVSLKRKGVELVTKERGIQEEADAVLLGQFTPPSILINADSEILQLRGDTEEFLKLPSGKATLNLLKIVRDEFVSDLRGALFAAKKNGVLVKKDVHRHSRLDPDMVLIEVMPLKTSEGKHFLVIFRKHALPPEKAPRSKTQLHSIRVPSSKANDRRIEQLENELARMRDTSRTYAEEQEAAVEELQSANEEVLSSNEELQSINEELETSTEELESTNEELNTVNQELQTRNDELTEARDYAESIISTMRNPLLILDKELRIKTANQSFCRTFRTTKEETEGHFLYELGNRQWDAPELRTLLSEVLPQKNVVFDFEISRFFPLIGYRVFHLNARVLDQSEQGKLILLAFEDVTEAQEINKQKDEFLGIASHEIKTPITTIKTFTELLARKLSSDDRKQYTDILEHITTQSDRLMILVTDLLSFSQIQAGKFLLNKEQFDLEKLIERNVRALRAISSLHEIVIEGRLPTPIVADASRIEQVLINLLTNALKYSPDGKKVIVRMAIRDGNAVISVQDFGPGIAARDQKSIFERFYRGSEAGLVEKDERTKGFGLGLFISAEIIEKHGGAIWVESTPGKGSIFYFTLPLPHKISQ